MRRFAVDKSRKLLVASSSSSPSSSTTSRAAAAALSSYFFTTTSPMSSAASSSPVTLDTINPKVFSSGSSSSSHFSIGSAFFFWKVWLTKLLNLKRLMLGFLFDHLSDWCLFVFFFILVVGWCTRLFMLRWYVLEMMGLGLVLSRLCVWSYCLCAGCIPLLELVLGLNELNCMAFLVIRRVCLVLLLRGSVIEMIWLCFETFDGARLL